MARGLSQDDVRQIALALPGTEESSHMGRPDLRVGGKIFATLPEDGLSVNVKVERDQIEALVRADPAAYESIWNGSMLGVTLAKVSKEILKQLLTDAHTRRAEKKTKKTAPRKKR